MGVTQRVTAQPATWSPLKRSSWLSSWPSWLWPTPLPVTSSSTTAFRRKVRCAFVATLTSLPKMATSAVTSTASSDPSTPSSRPTLRPTSSGRPPPHHPPLLKSDPSLAGHATTPHRLRSNSGDKTESSSWILRRFDYHTPPPHCHRFYTDGNDSEYMHFPEQK